MKKLFFNLKGNKEDMAIEKLAILLALTDSKEEEKEYIEEYKELGYLAAVTGVAGMDGDVKNKIVNAVVGAGLNEEVISKNIKEMHAIVHATAEACTSARINTPVSQSFQLKVAIVKQEDWICVAIYGNMAVHKITNHKTIGIGVMHL